MNYIYNFALFATPIYLAASTGNMSWLWLLIVSAIFAAG